MKIIKRNGEEREFQTDKIRAAIIKANKTVPSLAMLSDAQIDRIVRYVDEACEKLGRPVAVEEIQDMVEQHIMAEGAYDVAKNYIIYRKKRERARNTIQIRTGKKAKSDITDQSLLLVSSMTEGEVTPWDRVKITNRIVEALKLDKEIASGIAKDVESQIIASGMKRVNTSLIRELVNNALIDHGFHDQLQDLTMYRVPRDFIWNLMGDKNTENSNIRSNNPEAVSFDIASLVLKQFAFDAVFSKDVADAHATGLIHVHDANFPHRYYCGSHSIEYIKKYGLKGLVTLGTTSKPAKSASVLTGHLNTYLASMQAYYAGALGLGYVNTFYAPYLMGMTDKEIKQVAQELIFNASQNAFSRGGQCLFIDTNIDTGVPAYLKSVPAIGPGGHYMFVPAGKSREDWVPLEEATPDGEWWLVYRADGNNYAVVREKDGKQAFQYPEIGRVLTYGDFEDEAQRMCSALLDVWYEGDANGHVFEFPKCDFHVDADTFTDPKREALFDKACRLASHNGSTYFVFDRDSVSLASCCFTGDTKVLVKGGSGAHVQLKSFTELAEASYREARYNLAVYHNGGWSTAGLVKLEGRGKSIYQITTANKKVQKVTCDHIVPTLAGDKRADQVTEDDYILFSTLPLAQSKPNNSTERQALTYAQGIVIGAYLGDGSIEQQHDWKPAVNFSLNAEKYEHLVPYIEQAMKAWDVDGELTLHTPYNNVYPVHIASWGLKERIREWVSGSYCHEKRLNLDCLKEAQEFRRGILDGIYATDGGNSNRIYTTSEGLVDDLEVVCTSLGIQTVIDVSDRTGEDNVVIRGQEYNRNYPVWCVRWYDNGTRRQYSDLYKTKNNSIYFKVTNIETLPEEDTVYCFEIKDGNEPYFTLPNGIITHNCRLKVQITDKSMLLHPERLRTVGFGNVTVNVPQCSYRARRKEADATRVWDAFIKEIDNAMDLAVKCHMEKREFLREVMKPGGPMWQIAKPANDGKPYMGLDDCVYIIGMIGVNDAIQFLYGKQFHESEDAFDKGLKVISHMFHRCKEYSQKYGLVFKLEESPAESAARRLAKADLMYYRDEALKVYKGDDERYAYYTNSIHISADADVTLVERIRKQSMFHSAIESGAIIHAFIGEEKPEPGAIAELVRRTFLDTQAAQLTFSPEFTYCQDCGGQQRGLHETCDQCGSTNVVGETRVVGYFSVIQEWNKSKRYGELVARQHGQYRVCTVDDEEAGK